MADKHKSKTAPPSEWIAMDSGGVTWFDLIVFEDPCSPEADRMAAIHWLAEKWFRKPIARQRFRALAPRILAALGERAQTSEATPQAELKRAVIQALLIALGELEKIGGIFAPEPRQQFLRRLNNLVVEDLLGPKWRRAPNEVAYEDAETLQELLSEEAVYAEVEVEAALDLDALVSKAGLSKAETEVVMALRQSPSLTDAAEKLGIKPGTARVRWHRAKEKLKAATGM